MLETGLQGPYSLSNEVIDEKVTKKSLGVYVLGYVGVGGFVPKYVGRSDRDLNSGLKEWVGGKYSRFKFDYFSSPKEAFEKECGIYHDWKDQLDNEQHPERPNNKDWGCPRCNVFK